jgi:hypothetical protein
LKNQTVSDDSDNSCESIQSDVISMLSKIDIYKQAISYSPYDESLIQKLEQFENKNKNQEIKLKLEAPENRNRKSQEKIE